MNIFQSIAAWFKKIFSQSPTTPKVDSQPVVQSPVVSTLTLQAPLAWELPCNDGQVNQGAHPERRAWSTALFNEILSKWDIISKAKDLTTIYPSMLKLNKAQQITVMAELMSRVAEYECSWNPRSADPDVTGRSDLNSLASGFFQLNVEDQKTYKTGTSFTHEELLDPYNNIKAGIGIIATMVSVRGKITRSPGDPGASISEFFETLIFGAKYDSISKILPAVKKFGDQFLSK